MPIEIRELHIRVTVTSEGGEKSAAKGNDAAGAKEPLDKAALIAECVEQVMEILQQKKER